MRWIVGLKRNLPEAVMVERDWCGMLMIVCHEGAQEDEVLRAAMLHMR